jgi:hypothetical protein
MHFHHPLAFLIFLLVIVGSVVLLCFEKHRTRKWWKAAMSAMAIYDQLLEGS